ncbi:hypothetical protein [Crocosphaera sp. Alani8]|uniref:hypothetical protein n=1 Tax=Crocosphaera sp. Alani8 TaxID=3038952 RepID=UPI00313B0CCD
MFKLTTSPNQKKTNDSTLSKEQEPEQKPGKEQYSRLIPKENKLLSKFVLSSLIIHLVTVTILGFFAIVLYRLAVRPAPTLVQLEGGQAISVTAGVSTYREPELIKKFVGQTATSLYNWSGKIKGEKDSGIVVNPEEELIVTTPVWSASFSLSEKDNYRVSFLENLAVFTNKLPINIWGYGNSFLKISHIRDPIELKPGHWQVDMIAYLLLFDRGKLVGQGIPFNKTFYVKAIEQPPLLLDEQATAIQKAIWNSRSAQLEIENITDLQEE